MERKGEGKKGEINGKFKETLNRGLERDLGDRGQDLEFKGILNFLSLPNL